MNKKIKRTGLLLEDGSFWPGKAAGATTTKVGELVFHTAHQGYQEILTDPSYARQIIIFSSVQIGNQGFHSSDFESEKIWASGCVMRDMSETRNHWRRETSLQSVLEKQDCPAIVGIDTRRLILHVRNSGNLWGVLSTEPKTLEEMTRLLRGNNMQGMSLTEVVSTKKVYRWTEGSVHLGITPVKKIPSNLKRVVVFDFGVKRQILRYLIDSGFEEVIVVPSSTSAEEALSHKPDAILLSNGPGDPAAETAIVAEVKKLIGVKPLLGICLGHQLLGIALGFETYKLKFGHRAANHPVMNQTSDDVEITSQNHGFAVKMSDNSPNVETTHSHLNDKTVSGLRHLKHALVGIQFHPEASPGPLDSVKVFEDFKRGFARAG